MEERKPLLLYGDRHFVRFLFPFSLKEPQPSHRLGFWRRSSWHWSVIEHLAKRIERTGEWELQKSSSPDYILPHVADFLLPDPQKPIKERYVFAYKLSDRLLQQRVPKGGKCQLVVPRGKETFRFPMEIEEVQLYLFRSGVGILVIQVALKPGIQRETPPTTTEDASTIEPLPLDLDRLIQFNRAFRQLQRKGRNPYLQLPPRRLSQTQHSQVAPQGLAAAEQPQSSADEGRLAVSELIQELLAPLGREGEAWEAFYERRLIGYTFALVSRRDESGRPEPIAYDDLKEPLFWLRRSFDPDYLPGEADLHLDGNPEVLQTFENIYFGLSPEGGAVLAWDNGKSFIRDQLHARVRDNYFLVFLLALHQRLATIHLARLIAESTYLRYSHSPLRRSVVREVQQLRRRIFEFMVRCWFGEVSTMKMYAEVYQRWQRVFQVHLLLAEVKNKVEELDDYLQRVQMDRENRVISLVTWFFVPFTLLFSFWGMNFVELRQPGLSIFDPGLWKWTALAVILYYALILLYRGRKE